MFKFISTAFKELSHVVWPTTKETRTYMYYNIAVITVMTIFLALVGYGFRFALQQTKHTINPTSQITADDMAATQADLEALMNQQNLETFGLTGATVTVDEATTETPNETENAEAAVETENTEATVIELPSTTAENAESTEETTN